MIEMGNSMADEVGSDFEGLGEWWHPDSPEMKVSGVFRFNKVSGGLLTTTQTLLVPANAPHDSIIFGKIDGKLITLNSAFRTGSTFGSSGTETWLCMTYFVGRHLELGSRTLFKSVRIETRMLPKWVNKPRPMSGPSEVNDLQKGFSLTLETPEAIEMKLSDSLTGVLWWSVRRRSRPLELKEIGVITPLLEFEFDGMNFYDIHEKVIDPIISLMSFCIGHGDTLTSITLLEEGLDTSSAWDVEVFETTWYEFKLKNAPRFFQEFLVQFEDVEFKLEQFFSSWMAIYEISDSALQEYSVLLHESMSFGDENFLRIVRCLESWHTRNSKLRSPDAPMIEALLENLEKILPSDQYEFLETKSGSWTQLSLVKRLDDLIAGTEPSYRIFLEKILDFAKKSVATRNKFAHRSTATKGYFVGEEVFWATQQLTLLFVNVLLTKLEFSEAECRVMMRRSRLGQLVNY